MKILRALDSDYGPAEKFLKKHFQEEAHLYPLVKAKTVLVARNENEIIGIGKFFESSFYGEVPTVLIVVKDDLRRKDFGTKIHQALERSSSGKKGFYAFCETGDSQATGFLTHLGYQPCSEKEASQEHKVLSPQDILCYHYQRSIFSRAKSKMASVLYEIWMFGS